MPTNFGERLRTLRTKRGWTQREFADRSEGVFSQSTIHRLEAGSATPHMHQILAAGFILGVAPEEFLDTTPLSARVQVAARGESVSTAELEQARDALLPYLQLRVRLTLLKDPQ